MGFKFKKLERRLKFLLFKDSITQFIDVLDVLCSDYECNCDKTSRPCN
jgi:hypothetical protein